MTVEIMTRGKMIYAGRADHLVLPAVKGEMGVLAGHADFIVLLKRGEVRLSGGGGSRAFTIDGGFAEVSGDRVTVLPDSITTAKEAL